MSGLWSLPQLQSAGEVSPHIHTIRVRRISTTVWSQLWLQSSTETSHMPHVTCLRLRWVRQWPRQTRASLSRTSGSSTIIVPHKRLVSTFNLLQDVELSTVGRGLQCPGGDTEQQLSEVRTSRVSKTRQWQTLITHRLLIHPILYSPSTKVVYF